MRMGALAAGLILLTLKPAIGMNAARRGLMTWAGALVPAMFPYCFLAIALQRGGLGRALARRARGLMRLFGCPEDGAGALICGWLGGNPTGAKLTAICAERGGSGGQYLRLAWLSSACSPAFALGTLGMALPGCGWTLLISSWLGTLLGSLMLRALPLGANDAAGMSTSGMSRAADSPMSAKRRTAGASAVDERRTGALVNAAGTGTANERRAADVPPGGAAPQPSPAAEAAQTMLLIGCWVVLFTVLSAYLYWAALMFAPDMSPHVLAFAHALLEMAGGSLALSELAGPWTLPLISFALTFGGLSITMQALSLLRRCGVTGGRYAAGKALQGALAAAICALLERAGAVEALAQTGTLRLSEPSGQLVPALTALVLGAVAMVLNRRFIAYENADSAAQKRTQRGSTKELKG